MRLEGISFIERMPDGSCPMLDRQRRRCSIYDDRPFCCRLFPIDILKLDGQLQWAISGQCPQDHRAFACADESDGKLGYGSISAIVQGLGMVLDGAEREFCQRKEGVAEGTELLERDIDNWVAVAPFEGGGIDGERRGPQGEGWPGQAGLAKGEARREEE